MPHQNNEKTEAHSDGTLMAQKPKRIDLYVDESGQDTKGELFVVAVVAVENSDESRQHCESFEKSSGKGKVKWRSAQKERRLAYIRTIISDASSLGITLFYSNFRRTTDYDSATINGIAKVIRRLRVPGSRMYVHVDGLSKTKCNVYKTHLRQLSCPVKKVSGVGNDKNEPLIRLADALAGASAELLKYQDRELNELFSQAEQNGILVSL